VKIPQPIVADLRFTQQSQQQCRVRTLADLSTGESCIRYIDFRNRSVNFSLHTLLSDLNVGLNLSYTSRRSFVGTNIGNSQFQIGLFGNFELTAGRELTESGIR
jgi:hypothetical protein